MRSGSNISLSVKIRGLILVLTAAISWGGSGAVAQYLFQHQGISTEWLTVMRLLLAGVLMLLFGYKSAKQRTWEIWRDKQDRLRLVLYGVFGMLAVQYTYFKAIYYGNAATATVLQYLAPIFVTCYLAIHTKQFPAVKKLFAMSLAVLGTFFLITKGNIHTLSISGGVFFLGNQLGICSYILYHSTTKTSCEMGIILDSGLGDGNRWNYIQFCLSSLEI
jgi:drug/metabolite transporter (DMT)-like permease